MPIYKIVKLAVMPPGCLILALLIMALLLWINAKSLTSKILYYINKFVAILAVLLAGFTLLLSADAVSQRLLNNLEYRYHSGAELILSTNGKEGPVANPAAAIFILGGDTAVRCQGALQLYKQTGLDLVVSGYQGEAGRMRAYLLAHGVPDYKIIQEPKATNTKDHLKYMLPIAMEKGYHRIYLVTSAFHMPRSMMIMEQGFTEKGIKLIPYGCGHQTTPDYSPMPHEWAPNMLSFYQGTTALNEYIGMLVLKLLV